MSSVSTKTHSEALRAFQGDEGAKSIAKRLGVTSVKLRGWWTQEFGLEQMKERGRLLQRQRTLQNNKKRAGKPVQVKQRSVLCEICGESFTRNLISIAKSRTLLCDTCRVPKKSNPEVCPVCGLECESKKGLATHFRHQKQDFFHAEFQRQKKETQFNELSQGVDWVVCQECGFQAKALSSHIRIHDLTWNEYARKYPGASLWSEASSSFRSQRIRETHDRRGFEVKDFDPYLDEKGELIVASAAKGLKASQDTIRIYAKDLKIPTRNRLAAQKRVLDLVSKLLGEKYQWEWSDDRVRSPRTGHLLYYDGYFKRSNLLVEYHGPQHFQFVPKWHRTLEAFTQQQDIDKYKTQMAEALGFDLIVVRYTDPLEEEFLQRLLQDRTGYYQRQAKLVDEIDVVLDRVGSLPFPVPCQPQAQEAKAELEKLKRIRQREQEGLILPRSYTGNALCRGYFPNIYNARRKGHPSAREAWQDERELRKAIRTQLQAGHPTTPDRILKALTFHHRLPAVFRPAFARFIYEKFCRPGEIVWDPCAGYGGRLMGAVAAEVQYIGTDIEPETVEGNQNLARDLGYKAEVHLGSALEVEVPAVRLVFTSPPYFDMEQYSDQEGQPHVSYPNRKAWIEHFLIPLATKGIQVVEPGGHLVLVLPLDLQVAVLPACVGALQKPSIEFELPNGKRSVAQVFQRLVK